MNWIFLRVGYPLLVTSLVVWVSLAAQQLPESSTPTTPSTTPVRSAGEAVIAACAEKRCPERRYWGVAIKDMAKNKHTHVVVEGLVTLVRKEPDGDLHIRLNDGEAFVVLEVIPSIPLNRPKKGQRIRAFGISRTDKVHGWPELHPVEAWQVIR